MEYGALCHGSGKIHSADKSKTPWRMYKSVYFFSPLWSMEPFVMEAVKFVQLTSPKHHGYKGVYLLILVPCGVWSVVMEAVKFV